MVITFGKQYRDCTEKQSRHYCAEAVRQWELRCKAEARVSDLEAIVEQLQDDALVQRVAKECNDDLHDDSWCPTCEARADGIEAYRAAVLGGAAKKAEEGN